MHKHRTYSFQSSSRLNKNQREEQKSANERLHHFRRPVNLYRSRENLQARTTILASCIFFFSPLQSGHCPRTITPRTYRPIDLLLVPLLCDKSTKQYERRKYPLFLVDVSAATLHKPILFNVIS